MRVRPGMRWMEMGRLRAGGGGGQEGGWRGLAEQFVAVVGVGY